MQIYNGKGVSGGIAIGRIRVYKKRGQEINCISVTDTDKELIRFRDAKKEAARQLDILYEKALKDLGEENAAIFEAHQMILEDIDFNESVEAIVQSKNVNIEYAVFETGKKIAEIFAQMDDSYMKERAADVKDVSERLLNILKGASDEIFISDEPVIIAARELAPSETIQLDKSKVLSFVTTLGSSNSHTAILARMMAIPAVARVELPLDDSIDGKLGIVDGEAGLIYVGPDEETCKEMQLKKQQEHQKQKMLQQLRGKESTTSDGQKVMLYANIGSVEDIDAAVRNDAEGVGLSGQNLFIWKRKIILPKRNSFRYTNRQQRKWKAGGLSFGHWISELIKNVITLEWSRRKIPRLAAVQFVFVLCVLKYLKHSFGLFIGQAIMEKLQLCIQ